MTTSRPSGFLRLASIALLVSISGRVWAGDIVRAEGRRPSAEGSMQSEIDALRAEISDFRREQDRRWIDDLRRQEIRAVVADVVADAGTRTSFADAAFTAGWRNGFRLAAADGSFSLKLSGEIQLWYVVNHRQGDEPLPRNPPGTLWGAENRRTRWRFSGHVGDPSIQYRSQLNVTPFGGVAFLEFAYLKFLLSPELDVQVGQFRPLFLREWIVPARDQLAVDRSVVAACFNPGFAQGVQLDWRTDDVRVVGWFGDGLGARAFGPARTNTANTPWNDTPTRWAATGRFEWKAVGEWSQFDDFTSPPGSPTGVLFGVDVIGQEVNDQVPDADGVLALGASADASIDLGGASFMVSGVWEHNEPKDGPARNPWGLTVQAAAYVAPDVEFFGRYSYLDYDSAIPVARSVARYDGVTVGWNWFINPDVKLTMDWGMNFASLESGELVSTSIGYRLDEPGRGHQWAWRTQLQLLF